MSKVNAKDAKNQTKKAQPKATKQGKKEKEPVKEEPIKEEEKKPVVEKKKKKAGMSDDASNPNNGEIGTSLGLVNRCEEAIDEMKDDFKERQQKNLEERRAVSNLDSSIQVEDRLYYKCKYNFYLIINIHRYS